MFLVKCFNQQTGASQAVHWSKSSLSAFKQVFPPFPSQMEKIIKNKNKDKILS